MSTVETAELGHMAEIVMGTSPPGSSYNHAAIGDPLLNGPTEFGPRHPTPVLFTTEARRYAEPGDLLFCVRGSTTGRMNWADRRYAIGRGVAAIRGRSSYETRFLRAAIEAALPGVLAGATGSTMPNLNVDAMRRIPVPLNPDRERVGEIFAALDDLIDNNRRQVEALEEMARSTYREWFVAFRYPGHEDVHLVDSPLGPIPDGWAVKRVREVGATGAGPFGSKLGRKDYVADGVPVLRGTNLRVGGGFDESDFVYVTPEKAEELRSSATLRGDVVITQRGTLGQIALIPESSDHERYVLSQSQMKLTVNADAASTEFVYRQMSTADTTARFIAQAMSSGVPHVNLTLLRDFEILAPPSDLQHRFGAIVRRLDRQAWAVRAQARTLGDLRDLLLPRLVTGQIDVSHLDLDPLIGAAVA